MQPIIHCTKHIVTQMFILIACEPVFKGEVCHFTRFLYRNINIIALPCFTFLLLPCSFGLSCK